jgi:hypothetical protein
MVPNPLRHRTLVRTFAPHQAQVNAACQTDKCGVILFRRKTTVIGIYRMGTIPILGLGNRTCQILIRPAPSP